MKTYLMLLTIIFINTASSQNWTKNYDYVDAYNNGLAKVESNKKTGFVDSKGNLVIPLQFDEAYPFQDGFAAVRSGLKWGYINIKGKVTVPFSYEDACSFWNGRAKIVKLSRVGYIDTSGTEVIKPIYLFGDRFEEGVAAVCNEKNMWGFIDLNGKDVISFKYNYASHFSEGIAQVMVNGIDKLIDKHGNEISKPE